MGSIKTHDSAPMPDHAAPRRRTALRNTALTAALVAAYAYAPGAGAVNLTIGNTYDLGDSVLTDSTVKVIDGGVATGNGTQISGKAYEMLRIESGGSLTLENATLANTVQPNQNGRTVTATGANANAVIEDSTITLDAFDGHPGGHAFTAGVGAENGGHAVIDGGTITSSGSKRTVGIQANDGGSIDASHVVISTHSTFGHAVNAYRTIASPESETLVRLDHVTINTYDANYADGIQSANKGARVEATDTDITTVGTNSFGAEVFNGASASLTRGSITTSGTAAAGVRVYGGSLGNGVVTIDGTRVETSGAQAAGVVAADAAEQTSGTIHLSGSTIETHGANAAAVQSAYGSQITSGGGNTFHTYGANSTGVAALTGGSVSLLGSDLVTAELGNGIGSDGAGSTITTNGTAILTNGGKYGAYATNGGSMDLNGGSVTNASTSSGRMGLAADGAGTLVTAHGVDISTQGAFTGPGELSNAVAASHGAHIELTGGQVRYLGAQYGRGLLASTGASISADGVDISTGAEGPAATGLVSNAVHAYSGRTTDSKPEDTPTIELRDSRIRTYAGDSYGLSAQNIGSRITATDSAIETHGENSYGAVAYNGAVLDLAGTTIDTWADGARGISLNAMSTTQRPGTPPSPLTASTLFLSGGAIHTRGGTSAEGVAADAVYLTGGSSARIAGTQLLASGADASALHLEDSGSVILDHVRAESKSASITSRITQAGQVQDIAVGAGSNLTVNNGTLLQVSRSDAGMDGIVNLTLEAGSVSSGDIIDQDGLAPGGDGTRAAGGKTNFTIGAGAQWAGIVWGINDTSVGDGGSFEDSGGAPIEGNVTGGENSTIVFANGATISEGVQTRTGSTASFNGPTTIGGAVVGTGSHYVFLGATTVGQTVSGTNTSFQFSQGQPTLIRGSVVLDIGSSLKGGTVQAPISIQGSAIANSGSTLGGNLLVDGSLGGNGGTLSPGNSVGTQSYGTSAGFSGNYVAEVNSAGQSDLIIIRNGDFDLSGIGLTVRQENGTGGYVLDHDYTIVKTEAGRVLNTFANGGALDDSFAGTLVKLDPVKYGANDVRISLSVDADKAADRGGLSRNQNATLDGVLSVAGRNAAADAALQMQTAARRDALDQLSGEAHASTQAALMQSGDLVARALASRMRGNLGAGMLPGAPIAQAGGRLPAGAMPRPAAYPLWAQVSGNWSSLEGDGNAARIRTRTGGLFVGGDLDAGRGWRLGAALGYRDGRLEVDDRGSSSDVGSYTVALYGGKAWDAGPGKLSVLAGAAYTRHDIESRRSVTVGGGQTLKADYHADAAQLFTELAYAMPAGEASVIEPYAGVSWLGQKTEGFTESGGPAALRSDSQRDDITALTLGLRGKTRIEFGAGAAELSAGAGWRHAAGDVDPGRSLSFVEGGGGSFRVSGAPIARDAAVLDLGAQVAVGRNTVMGLAYSGQYGGGNTDHAATLSVKVRF